LDDCREPLPSNGTHVYVPNLLSNNVSVIDTSTNTVTATISTGTAPETVAFPTRTQDPIGSLIAQVQAVVAGGGLRQNQGDALINKLHNIQTKLENGQTGSACNQLGAFINQVNAFINNRSLTASQGEVLIDAANSIKVSIQC